jgi:hypothetical protein
VQRRIRICCTALICALFLCVELFPVSTVSSAVSFAGSISAISGESSQPTISVKPHGESKLFWIRINIPAFKLTLFSGESPIKEYRIAVGNPTSPSRIGTCKVIGKAKYPTWYPPDGRPPVPPGPDNPISCRWLGLSWSGYGIHGTNNPASIGKAVTLGCIRMHDKDVMELFDIVPIGTNVEFAYETVEVNSCGNEPMSMRLTVYRDLYRLGTNTVERVMESIRTCLVQVAPGATLDMTSDIISPLMPDIDQHKLVTLVNAARGKPEPIPWQVRVELGVTAEPVYLSGDNHVMEDRAYMMAYPPGVAGETEGATFAWDAHFYDDSELDTMGDIYGAGNHSIGNRVRAPVRAPGSDMHVAVGDPCTVSAAAADVSAEAGSLHATAGGASTGASSPHATDATAGDASAGASFAYAGTGDASAGADYGKAIDARIEGDQVLVALRPVAEAFGYRVGWDAESQGATVDQKAAKGVVRGARFYVTLDELRRLLEDVSIAWDPQTLTLRVVSVFSNTSRNP